MELWNISNHYGYGRGKKEQSNGKEKYFIEPGDRETLTVEQYMGQKLHENHDYHREDNLHAWVRVVR